MLASRYYLLMVSYAGVIYRSRHAPLVDEAIFLTELLATIQSIPRLLRLEAAALKLLGRLADGIVTGGIGNDSPQDQRRPPRCTFIENHLDHGNTLKIDPQNVLTGGSYGVVLVADATRCVR